MPCPSCGSTSWKYHREAKDFAGPMAVGAALGSAFPGVGTLIGAVGGALVGASAKLASEESGGRKMKCNECGEVWS